MRLLRFSITVTFCYVYNVYIFCTFLPQNVCINVTKYMPILLYGLDACPVSSRGHKSLNHVVISCGRNIFDVNTSELAAECFKMFRVSDVAEAVARRKTDLLTDTHQPCSLRDMH